jgi:acetyl-CoA C-acetyltransferase
MIGGAMSPLTKLADQSSFDLVRKTVDQALADAGLPRDALEGLAITPPGLASHSTAMFVSRLGAYLGIPLKSLACLENGGCSSALALRWAVFEVASGRCEVAVAVGADQRYNTRPEKHEEFASFMDRTVMGTMAVYGSYDGVYGLGAPIPYYAMSAQRYMHETGATPEDFAWASVRLREHAHRHPHAMFRDKALSVAEVLDSKMLSPPLHLQDCSQFVSGAAAVVIASEDVARSLESVVPVKLRGWGQHHDPSAFSAGARSLTSFPAVKQAAAEAYEVAGVAPADIDVAEVYGVFSSTELMLCEDLGFFERGQAGAAFREGRATHGGDIVIDPSGGRLSLGHPACATPLLEAVEICHQLQGKARSDEVSTDRQVPNASLGLMHAEHGMLNGSIVTIWERGDA